MKAKVAYALLRAVLDDFEYSDFELKDVFTLSDDEIREFYELLHQFQDRSDNEGVFEFFDGRGVDFIPFIESE